jgi:redox-sensitive bicupin YhaK (pirin superfamily)
MGFRVLRDEDRVQPSQGFGTHGHRGLAIISYVLGGAPAHKDSLKTGSVLRLGESQHMTVGSGSRRGCTPSVGTNQRGGSRNERPEASQP